MKSSIKTVRMSLGTRSYSIHIGSGAIRAVSLSTATAYVIADERLIDARAALRATLAKSGIKVHEFPVPAGERLKDIDSIYPLYGALTKAKANRDSTIFALGGGSIGDAAGFIAATYMRGIKWVGIPTTLLAQVDSAVGGKTGINHSDGKNLMGAFHQPSLVVCDTDLLRTLGKREVVSGLGEVIKYGIVFDPKFYAALETDLPALLVLDPTALTRAIYQSVKWKCKTVARDELDRNGLREVLNFGHTYGHALESETRYKTYQHGEAVIWGMRFALALSVLRKKLSRRNQLKIDAFLARLPVPALTGVPFSRMEAKMKNDKKVRSGRINFVLLNRIGRTISDANVSHSDLVRAEQELRARDAGSSNARK